MYLKNVNSDLCGVPLNIEVLETRNISNGAIQILSKLQNLREFGYFYCEEIIDFAVFKQNKFYNLTTMKFCGDLDSDFRLQLLHLDLSI